MTFLFDQFELDTKQLELREDGVALSIEPKSFNLLVLLIENHDRVLSKDEIFDQIWSGVFVSDATLSSAIAQIRRVLKDNGQTQKYVKTVHGRGFRFMAQVTTDQDVPAKLGPDAVRDPAGQRVPSVNGPPVIAILPFDLIGTDTTHSAIADALPIELISTLTQLKWVKVVARASSFQFRGADVSIDEIRSKLGATYVLTGSIELANARLNLFPELIDARTQQVVWSDAFGGTIEDIFDLRVRIAQEIATVVEYRLAFNETERLSRVPSENLDAWGHYHRGVRAMFHYNQTDNEAACAHFSKAIEIDPTFARAHAALSYSEFQNYFQQFGKEYDRHRDLTLAHAERAMQHDPLDPYSNLMLGRAKWIQGDIEGGLSSIDRSLSLAPNYAFAFYNSALLNTILCDGHRGEVHVASALARSPIDPHIQTMIGTRALASFVRDDMDLAISYADQAMTTVNAHVHVYLIAAGIQALAGNDAKARQAMEEVTRRNVDFETSGFRKHFDLRSAEKKGRLFGALEAIAA